MTRGELKAIIMAIMSPKMSSRAINESEIRWVSEGADKIIDSAKGGE